MTNKITSQVLLVHARAKSLYHKVQKLPKLICIVKKKLLFYISREVEWLTLYENIYGRFLKNEK